MIVASGFVCACRLHEEERSIRALTEAKPKPSEAPPSDQSTKSTQGPGASQTPHAAPDGALAADGPTLVERMFGGRLSTGIRCLRCHSVSEKEEPFTDLSLAFCPPEGQVQHNSPPCGAVNGGGESLPVEMGPVTRDGVSPCIAGQLSPPPPIARNGPPLALPDLVDYLLAPEILDEENRYFCERCGSLQRAERGVRIVAAPEYLILTLLRFSYDAALQLRRKILEDVRVPLRMRLPVHQTHKQQQPSPATPPPRQREATAHPSCVLTATRSPDSGENQAKKLKPSQREEEEEEEEEQGEGEEAGRTQKTSGSANGGRPGTDVPKEGDEDGTEVWTYSYVLTSVVMHSGMSSESGHYYTYGRNMSALDYEDGPAIAANHLLPPSGGQDGVGSCSQSELTAGSSEVEGSHDPSSKDWILFNDSRVTYTTFNSVQNVTSRFPKDTAYVLIYRKQGSGGATGGGGVQANGLRLGMEPPLQKELMDAITKDNKLYLQVSAHCSQPSQCRRKFAFLCRPNREKIIFISTPGKILAQLPSNDYQYTKQ